MDGARPSKREMARGKRTSTRWGPAAVSAHWREDHRSKLHSVMQRLLGRCSMRGDIVFDVNLDRDEAVLRCDALEPPRHIKLSVEEHLASVTGGEQGAEAGYCGKGKDEMLEELKQDDWGQRAAAHATAEEKKACSELGISHRRTARKSIERHLCQRLLEDLVEEGILSVNPNASNCANAFELGPNFVEPQPAMHSLPKMRVGKVTSNEELMEVLDAVLSGQGWNRGTMKAELNEALKSFIGRDVRKADVVWEEDPENPTRLTLRIPSLEFVADYEHDADSPETFSRKAAEDQLCTTALAHFKEMLAVGNLAVVPRESSLRPQQPGPKQPGLVFQPPHAQGASRLSPHVTPGQGLRQRQAWPRRPPPPNEAIKGWLTPPSKLVQAQRPAQPAQPTGVKALETWCEERSMAFEEEVGRASETSWKATIRLPACDAMHGEEMSATGCAGSKDAAMHVAATALLAKARRKTSATQVFGDMPAPEAPEAKRPRIAPRVAEAQQHPRVPAPRKPPHLRPGDAKEADADVRPGIEPGAGEAPPQPPPQQTRPRLGTIPRAPIGASIAPRY